jgi:hypothetical protein
MDHRHETGSSRRRIYGTNQTSLNFYLDGALERHLVRGTHPDRAHRRDEQVDYELDELAHGGRCRWRSAARGPATVTPLSATGGAAGRPAGGDQAEDGGE